MDTNIEKLIALVDRLLSDVGNIELYWTDSGWECTKNEDDLEEYNRIIEALSNVRNDMTEPD